MKRSALFSLAVVVSLVVTIVPLGASASEDWGDAPEGAIAYPSTGVMGAFPTCLTVPLALYI